MGNANITPDNMIDIFLRDSLSLSTVSADVLSKASNEAIYRLLPLLMISAEIIGENCTMEQRDEFKKLLSKFREVISRHRWTKLRFLLLAKNPCFQTFWNIVPTYVHNAYKDPVVDVGFFEEVGSRGEEEFSRGPPGSVERVNFSISVDVIDIQSVEFWSQTAHRKGIDSGYAFPFTMVTHPFFPLEGAKLNNEAAIGESVKVLKVFSSIAHPKLVQLRRPKEQTLISEADNYTNFTPLIMVKAGDNLMQDSGVMLIFRCMNSIWENDSELLEKHGGSPYVKPYECIPTSSGRGLIEGLSNITSLNEFAWKEWSAENGDTSDSRTQMLRTSVGAYIANYIIGVRDRHFDNILIQNGDTMFHIDYSYILGDKPPVDGPPISLSPGMEQAFKAVGIWDEFVEFSKDAFMSLRSRGAEIVQMAKLVFPKAAHSAEKVESFLRGPRSLNMDVDDMPALASVEQQIRESSTNLGNWFKMYTHDNVVPLWYNLLGEGFPPAKAAMEFYNNYMQSRREQLAEVKVDIDDAGIIEIN